MNHELMLLDIAMLRARIGELRLLKATSPALVIGFDIAAYCEARIAQLQAQIDEIENPKVVVPGPVRSIQA